jgi:4-diphosphocytidyl-2-C-methyl-D-erythritol kinase
MILYPPAKINLGLHVLYKRSDGFHEIESVMYPLPFYDVLEILPAQKNSFKQSGIIFADTNEKNLCEKAVDLMQSKFNAPPVSIHLRKQIPVGAGLGGGSADAAYVILGLNELFRLELSNLEMEEVAATLGSDCPFFIQNKVRMVSGRGEILSDVDCDLSEYFLVLLNPKIHISTKEAYSKVHPKENELNIASILQENISTWQSTLKNDFESPICKQYPLIQECLDQLKIAGAIYTAMSGSGSTVFGIFSSNDCQLPSLFNDYIIFQGKLML